MFVETIYINLNKTLNIILAAILLSCLSILSAFSQNQTNTIPLTDEERAWISEHPVVKTSSNTSYAPFDFMSAGQPAGFSIDYMNLIGSKVGLNIEYVTFENWSKMLEGAQNKEILLTHSISKNEQRSEYLNFSEAYYNSPMVYFGRLGSPMIESLDDLKNKKIGVTSGHIIGDIYKEKYPHLELVKYNSNVASINGILLNEIDVFIGDFPTVNFYLSQSGLSELKALGDDLAMKNSFTEQRIGVVKDEALLMGLINKAVASVSVEEINIISKKWLKGAKNQDDIGLTDDELLWLSQHKTIHVATDPHIAPIEFIDSDGEIKGITGDYLEIISEKLNVEFEWIGNQNWAEGMAAINSKKADIVSNIIKTPEREKQFEFTDSF